MDTRNTRVTSNGNQGEQPAKLPIITESLGQGTYTGGGNNNNLDELGDALGLTELSSHLSKHKIKYLAVAALGLSGLAIYMSLYFTKNEAAAKEWFIGAGKDIANWFQNDFVNFFKNDMPDFFKGEFSKFFTELYENIQNGTKLTGGQIGFLAGASLVLALGLLAILKLTIYNNYIRDNREIYGTKYTNDLKALNKDKITINDNGTITHDITKNLNEDIDTTNIIILDKNSANGSEKKPFTVTRFQADNANDDVKKATILKQLIVATKEADKQGKRILVLDKGTFQALLENNCAILNNDNNKAKFENFIFVNADEPQTRLSQNSENPRDFASHNITGKNLSKNAIHFNFETKTPAELNADLLKNPHAIPNGLSDAGAYVKSKLTRQNSVL